MGIAKPFTQLHPPPPSSIHLYQPPPSSMDLHLAHFISALCNSLNVIRTKTLHPIGQFSKIYAKKFKVVCFDRKLEHMVSGWC